MKVPHTKGNFYGMVSNKIIDVALTDLLSSNMGAQFPTRMVGR